MTRRNKAGGIIVMAKYIVADGQPGEPRLAASTSLPAAIDVAASQKGWRLQLRLWNIAKPRLAIENLVSSKWRQLTWRWLYPSAQPFEAHWRVADISDQLCGLIKYLTLCEEMTACWRNRLYCNLKPSPSMWKYWNCREGNYLKIWRKH